MMTFFKYLLVFCSVLFIQSCSTKEKTDLLTIPVDVDRDTPLTLSDISEKVEAIELEVTDESLIQKPNRILYSSDFIIVQEAKSIMLFDNSGKFIRRIGSVGQGPAEFTSIADIAADFDSKRIYIFSGGVKLTCYDFEGNLIKVSPLGYYVRLYNVYLNYIDNKLLLLSESMITEGNRKTQCRLYGVDDNLLKSDSILVKSFDSNEIVYISNYQDYITKEGDNVYLYYFMLVPNNMVSDTLYLLNKNQLSPYLNIKFKNRGLSEGKKIIIIRNMFRSSRYVFAYYNHIPRQQFYFFCHDLKSGESFNMKDGLTDDIHTGKKVIFRPVDADANKFYYLHTNMKEDDLEEPNPTLYIGTFKSK